MRNAGSLSFILILLLVASIIVIASSTCQYAAVAARTNLRPIVGIITEPTAGSALEQFGKSFINADYVKWLEGSGARVAVIPFDASEEQLSSLFNGINGLVFPGGADIIDHTPYYYSARYLFDLALKANQQDDYFVVWGTCLGFELLNMLVADGNFSVLSDFDAENISLPLSFTPDGLQTSRIFREAPSWMITALQNENLTENFHHYGISPETFQGNPNLVNFFNVISTSFDRENREFVSTIEAKKFPIYGVQWHPERTLFEWHPYESINHSVEGVRTMQFVGDFLVNEARKNFHAFSTAAAEASALIYNYAPTDVSNLPGSVDMQMYFFDF